MANRESNTALNIQQELFRTRRSALRTYQDIAVGRRGWGALLQYEFLQMFLRSLPGAAGLVLRRAVYARWLGNVGRNVIFGCDVAIRHPHKIRIGRDVVIDDHAMLDAKGAENRGIEIGSQVVIGRNSILQCKNGDIRLGDGVNIGVNATVTSSNQVEIGDQTLVAAYSYIVGGGHDFARTDVPIAEQARQGRGIRIGADCWIGAGAVILDGIEIGEGTVVGASSVVTVSLPAYTIAVGAPARVIRHRKNGDGTAV